MLKKPVDSDSYLADLAPVKYLENNGSIVFDNDVTFFIGENGTGKSTLIEAIAIAYGFNPEGGSKNFLFSTVKAHSDLWENIRISRNSYPKDGFFLRAESFFNAASYVDKLGSEIMGCYGGISLHEQSHGESFMSLIHNRFRGNGLYILDEPEAALSPMRQMSLIAEMGELIGKGSQFIIATHSPMLMAFPNAKIYQINENGMCSVNYRETEHYTVTRRFMENPEKMMKYLLEE